MSSWFNNDLISVPMSRATVKAMTVAAALQEGAISPIAIMTTGRHRDRRASDLQCRWPGYGRINMAEMLGYSLNVGAATVAESLGPTAYYQSMKAFALASPGVDLGKSSLARCAGQSARMEHGRLWPHAFGQGFYATPRKWPLHLPRWPMTHAYEALHRG